MPPLPWPESLAAKAAGPGKPGRFWTLDHHFLRVWKKGCGLADAQSICQHCCAAFGIGMFVNKWGGGLSGFAMELALNWAWRKQWACTGQWKENGSALIRDLCKQSCTPLRRASCAGLLCQLKTKPRTAAHQSLQQCSRSESLFVKEKKMPWPERFMSASKPWTRR